MGMGVTARVKKKRIHAADLVQETGAHEGGHENVVFVSVQRRGTVFGRRGAVLSSRFRVRYRIGDKLLKKAGIRQMGAIRLCIL